MSTPDDPFFLDERLHDAFDDAGTPTPLPAARVWAGVQAKLPPPVAPRPLRPMLLSGAGGVLLGLLLMWWLHPEAAATLSNGPRSAHITTLPAHSSAPQTRSTAPQARSTTPQVSGVTAPGASVAALTQGAAPRAASVALPTASAALHVTSTAPRTVSVPPSAAAAATPAVIAPLPASGVVLRTLGVALLAAEPGVPTILVPLVRAEVTLLAAGTDSSRATRARRRAALLDQRAELTRLRWRTDSLLLTLGEPGGRTLPAGPDSVAVPPRLTQRWSVALAFAPERNFFGLGAPAGDTLSTLRRTHEQGRAGYNAALLAEYRLTDRLSVAGGVGVSAYGAELRLTDRRTLVTVAYDTAITSTISTRQLTNRAYAVKLVPEVRLTPRFNQSGQVAGYDTVWVERSDTTWTQWVQTDTLRTTSRTITPTVTKREEVSARILKPNYRFLTLPVLLRYRLTQPGARWWIDAAGGAQVQLFLGGTQLTTLDGRTYQTERVGAGQGPFRTLSVALLGSAGLNYALTSHLSASLAPTVRWQVSSVFKASTNLTQKPTATGVQLGLRLAF